jgi:thiamine-monophosphate kinase
MREADLIERLRRLATHPGARELRDDAAVLDGLVLTHDTIAEGVHFFPFDPPASVGWKLLAVNLSDLAAKGAKPVGALLSVTLSGDEWVTAFIDGVEAACESYDVPLLGGDTITLPPRAPRIVGLTAVGRAGQRTPARSGGKPGDRLWVAGSLGDAAAGLSLLEQDPDADGPLVDIFRRPVPLLEMGQALAPHATAMMDVSDGLLLDLSRLCSASGCGAQVDLGKVPLSRAFVGERGQDRTARLFAASGGDDYALLAALPAALAPAVTLSLPEKPTLTCIGQLTEGGEISLADHGEAVELPERLGYEHRTQLSPMDDRN